MFKFKCGQAVRVKVLTVVKSGVVHRRELSETAEVQDIVYTVRWSKRFHDSINVTEEDLEMQQKMPLGIVHHRGNN